jgi:hypothetical protein
MMLLLLLGVVIAAAVCEAYYGRKWSENVTVRLWFDDDRVYAGETTKLYEVIENRKRMPIPVLEVGFHTRRELDFADTDNTNVSDYIYKRDVFSVLGNQKITREIRVKCTKRGRYQASDVDITSYGILYGRHYSQGVETSAGIYVYAGNTDVSDVMLVCQRMLGNLQCSKRLYEDPFSFRTIRDYTIYDPMKTINWKASAKTGALMVNTFDSVESQKVMVMLDVEDSGILKYEDLVEESISIAATITRKLSRQGIEVGFAYNGTRSDKAVLPTNRGGELARIEKTLSEYDKNNGGSLQKFDELIEYTFENNKLSQEVLFIVVTKNFNSDILKALSQNVKDRDCLVVVPVYRGDKEVVADRMKSVDNIKLIIKEVGRA